jgi:hypothetical protein
VARMSLRDSPNVQASRTSDHEDKTSRVRAAPPTIQQYR